VLTDIQGNVAALDAVLADLAPQLHDAVVLEASSRLRIVADAAWLTTYGWIYRCSSIHGDERSEKGASDDRQQ